VDPQRVPLFAATVVALVGAALALYVVLPQAKARQAALEQKASLEQTATAAVGLAAERAALEDAVRGLAAVSADPRGHTSRQALEGAMIADLQAAARRHGVELLAIEPREGAEIDALKETVFEVELVGAYADMVAFLRDVRAEPEILVVRELTLMPLDDAGESDIHAVLVAAAFAESR
jgi:Tfp pilus assembly protein PilO